MKRTWEARGKASAPRGRRSPSPRRQSWRGKRRGSWNAIAVPAGALTRRQGQLLAGIGAASALWIGTGMLRRRRWLRPADLRGKVVYITGGSRGLGYAIAKQFAQHGARLAISARDERELATAEKELHALGAETTTVVCDVSKRAEAEAAVERVIAHFGRIDILVNAAGIIVAGPLDTQNVADFEEVMAINFWGALYTTRATLPQMEARREGRIVNITSIGGVVSVPHLLPYSTAKFAFVGFSEGLRAELAKSNVKVVTIVPGLMRTGSYLNTTIKGSHREEYALFTLLDSLPISSISAERAARQVVRATLRGDARRVLSLQARILALLHGLAPGLTSDVLGLINRMLPGTGGDAGQIPKRGRENASPITRSFLTWLNQRAAERLHQNAGQAGDLKGAQGELPSEEHSSASEIISSV